MASTVDDHGNIPLRPLSNQTPQTIPPTLPEDPRQTPAGITQHTPTGTRERPVTEGNAANAPRADPSVPTSGKRLVARKVYL